MTGFKKSPVLKRYVVLPFDGLFQGSDDGLNKENGVTELGIVVQVNIDLKIESRVLRRF